MPVLSKQLGCLSEGILDNASRSGYSSCQASHSEDNLSICGSSSPPTLTSCSGTGSYPTGTVVKKVRQEDWLMWHFGLCKTARLWLSTHPSLPCLVLLSILENLPFWLFFHPFIYLEIWLAFGSSSLIFIRTDGAMFRSIFMDMAGALGSLYRFHLVNTRCISAISVECAHRKRNANIRLPKCLGC
jgi:hypothetical protein